MSEVDVLSQLQSHLTNIEYNKKEICQNLTAYNENTGNLERGVGELCDQMRQLQTMSKNIEATKRTVVKVADKFNDSSKARVQLEKGATLELPELLASCDALQEAVRYAKSLKKSAADAASSKRLQEQEELLSEAAVVLDNRFRGILSSQLKSVPFAKRPEGQHRSLPHEVSFISPQEATNLYELARRMHGFDHTTDFSQHIGQVVQRTLKSCYTEIKSSSKKRKDTPGSHYIPIVLKYYKLVVESVTSLAIEIFKSDWGRYVNGPGSNVIPTFYQIDLISNWITAATTDPDLNTISKLYLNLDLLQIFQEGDWTVIPNIQGDRDNPWQKWNLLIDATEQRITHLATAYSSELVNPSIETPSDGTVLEVTVQACHLIHRISDTYGAAMFDGVMFKHSDLATFRDYVDNLYRVVSDTINKRSDGLIQKKKHALSYIFRMNNVQHLAEKTRNLGLSWVEDTAASFDLEVANLISCYIKDDEVWAEVLRPLKEQFRPSNPPSSGDREWVKKQLKKFNDNLDNRISKERAYQIPNKSLKAQLITSISRSLNPAYGTFLRYVNLPFSRPIKKYVIYEHPLDRLLSTELYKGVA
eukprot:TRINITY_DN12083_c0_g1_i1.p2 TRINITY_DN12083_c0_g1~~TRINITY_DN12083_c0_g1_i1.p2  ORF type:complete len:588 (+),score=98.31 TRINITY_DN12083_c0_g1_i1:2466-4229(+)